MRNALAAVFFFGCTFLIASAQTKQPAFEVASIKQTPQELPSTGRLTARPIGLVREDPSFVSYRNITMKALLMHAYGLKEFQISGPGWFDTEHYDINAKLPVGATEEQIPTMLQQLLTERFRMTVNWTTSQQTAYMLVIDGGGPKLTPSADQDLLDDQPDKARSVSMSSTVKLQGAPIAALVSLLSNTLHEPVADSTALKGRFDFTLNLSFQQLVAARQGPSTSASDDADYSPTLIFDAVRDLGLRLQPQKMDVKHLTVVKADRVPTEN